MAGIFDKIQKRLELRESTGGISPLHLADLPPNLRKVMRVLLREVQMTYEEICTFVDALPARRGMSREELDEALVELTKQGWLFEVGADERISYRVNLRRRPGSDLSQDIWSNLNNRIDKFAEEIKQKYDEEASDSA